MKEQLTKEYFEEAKNYIADKIDFKPEIALILGSALGSLGDKIENPIEIRYEDIPNFLQSTVEGHEGKLILGKLGGKNVVCMSGRFHYYEGYDFEQLIIPIRVFKLLGVKTLIVTNAAGGVNENFEVGDIMLIKDHIKLLGDSPLRGKNDEFFGPRFSDMTDAYDKEYRELVKNTAKDLKIDLKEGVYYYFMGPQFETPAEIRAIRILGGDAVGMSTATEVIPAVHCGIKVIGMSLITNKAAGMSEKKLSHEEVGEAGKKASKKFSKLVEEVVKRL